VAENTQESQKSRTHIISIFRTHHFVIIFIIHITVNSSVYIYIYKECHLAVCLTCKWLVVGHTLRPFSSSTSEEIAEAFSTYKVKIKITLPQQEIVCVVALGSGAWHRRPPPDQNQENEIYVYI